MAHAAALSRAAEEARAQRAELEQALLKSVQEVRAGVTEGPL